MKIGDQVMIPRTDGSQSPGEIIDIDPWGHKFARVKFIVGETFQGHPHPKKDHGRTAYKTVSLDELKPIEV